MGFGLWVLLDNQSFIAVLRKHYISHKPSELVAALKEIRKQAVEKRKWLDKKSDLNPNSM